MDSSQLYHQWFGIPPKDQPPNAYRLLGVEVFEADALVIEAAGEQRMLLLKARQSGPQGAQAQRLMNEVSQALRTLLNKTDRSEYDAGLQFEIGRQRESNWEEPISDEELADEQIEEIEPAAPAAHLSIRSEPRLHRPRFKKSSSSPTLLRAGIGSGVLLVLIILVVVLLNGGRPSRQTAMRPAQQASDTPVATAPRRVSAPKPTLAKPISVESGDFQFTPQEVDTIAPTEEIVQTATDPDSGSLESIQKPAEDVVAINPRPAPPAKSAATAPPDRVGERRLLTDKDFQFLGAFKLPQRACGQSTGYAAGCLALRMVDERPRLFSDSHIGTGGAVYEVAVPALAKAEPYPTASIVREWGDIYQGHKRKANGESYPLDGEVPTTGLRWDEAEQRLWWTYGQKYNTENQDAPTFGATRFQGDAIVAEGPWKLPLAQSWQRGGTLEIPAWFADKYTDGRRLGVGFGGYYSIFEGGSYGPALSAVSKPAEGSSPSFVNLLAYPIKHECVRNSHYQHVAESWMGKNPVGGRGTWNATDEIGGEISSPGAIWIDTPNKHGLLFFASLGTGRLAYEDGGVQAAGREDALYVYDPADLAKVAQKKADSWDPTPKFYPWKNPAPSMAGRAAGVAWNASARRLYLVFINAYVEGEEAYPVVVVYQI